MTGAIAREPAAIPPGALAGVGEGRVIVRLPNWLGDAMLALPALRAVRRMAPRSRLELHARPAVAEVFGGFAGLCDAVVSAGGLTPSGVLADVRRLRGAAACVLLPNSFASALPPFLARVPRRIGAARDGRSPLLTRAMRPRHGRHQASYYLDVVGADGEVSAADAQVELGGQARDRARRLAGDAPYLALVPGAAFGAAKRWGAVRFGELGRRLRPRGLEVLVLGTASEAALCGEVAALAGGRSLAGQAGGDAFAGILAGARLAAVNDSGALHLAAALGTPLLALFGATDPAATGPVTGSSRVLYRPVACSPCGLRECNRQRHECMEGISPEEAERAALELLATPAARPQLTPVALLAPLAPLTLTGEGGR